MKASQLLNGPCGDISFSTAVPKVKTKRRIECSFKAGHLTLDCIMCSVHSIVLQGQSPSIFVLTYFLFLRNISIPFDSVTQRGTLQSDPV